MKGHDYGDDGDEGRGSGSSDGFCNRGGGSFWNCGLGIPGNVRSVWGKKKEKKNQEKKGLKRRVKLGDRKSVV